MKFECISVGACDLIGKCHQRRFAGKEIKSKAKFFISNITYVIYNRQKLKWKLNTLKNYVIFESV